MKNETNSVDYNLNCDDCDIEKDLSLLDFELPALSEDEMLRIHSLSLQKAKLKQKSKPKKSIKFVKLLATAAVAVFAVLGIGASYLKVSDLFSNYLAAPKAVGDSVSGEVLYQIAADMYSNTMENMGAMISQQSTVNDITVTVQGAVADNDTLILLVDACAQDGTKLTGDISFGQVLLRVYDPETGKTFEQPLFDITKQDTVSATGTVRFLIKDKVSSDLLEKNAQLIITDLVCYRFTNGTEISSDYDNLYEIYNLMPLESRDQFTCDYMSDSEYNNMLSNSLDVATDSDGNPIWGYQLVDGTAQLDISNAGKNIVINNMGIVNDSLYLNITTPYADTYNLPTFALRNKQTGSILQGFIGAASDEEYTSYNCEIAGISSAEQLENYVLVENGGYAYVPIATGEWSFDFSLSFSDLTQTLPISYDMQLNQSLSIHLSNAQISPISITLNGICESGDFDVWLSNEFNGVKLIMTDGSIVKLDSLSASYDNTTHEFDISFVLPQVIDPLQVKTIEIGAVSIAVG